MIPFNAPSLVGQERRYLDDALASPDAGKYAARCERWLEDTLSARRVLLTPSCTAALEMAALLLDLAPGDEVILPSFTFVSTASAFALRGAVPVFVDIRPDTLNIDENRVAEAITPRTRAIAVVHYAGAACAMGPLRGIAQRHGIDVIEDAAHALLADCRGRPLGTLGRFGALSFHSTKTVHCGRGGALLINDERDVLRAEIMRERGTDRMRFLRGDVQKYSWIDIGSSFSMSELCSAYLFGQLEEAQAITARRLAVCAAYRAELAPLEAAGHVRLPPVSSDGWGNGHIFWLLTADAAARTRLLLHLRDRGIEATFHYIPLHTSPAGQRLGRTAGALAVTEAVSETILRLPLFAAITDLEVQRVADAVRGFYLQPPASTVS